MSEQETIEKFKKRLEQFEKKQRSKLMKYLDLMVSVFEVLLGKRC